MPDYAADRLTALLTAQRKKIQGAKVLILGVTYKKDVKDLRKSPPIKLIESLRKRGAIVSFHDPLVPYLDVDGLKVDGTALTPKALKAQDYIIVAVDHTAVNYAFVLKHAKAVFDLKNVYKGVSSKKITKL